jgi:ABC-type multidrug transport system fused ATPase/permease subunit
VQTLLFLHHEFLEALIADFISQNYVIQLFIHKILNLHALNNVQRYYIPTARELARLSQIQRAPILHHFAESLTGASSIRAYGQKERFRKANLGLVDNHSRPWFHNISAVEWLCFRLNMLSNFVFAFSLILLVSLPEGFINPSKLYMHKALDNYESFNQSCI